MKRPSFQFYPGDWAANPNLKRCTFAEKGIWLEVLCLMHDQPDYGVLRWPLKEIAEAVKCRPADLLALLRKGVLKGDDKQLAESFVYTPRHGRKDGEPVTLIPTQAGPVWYSSRMVKDEHIRTIRGESTRFGESKGDPPKGAPIPPFGDGASSSSYSSPSGKEKSNLPVAPARPPAEQPPLALVETSIESRKPPDCPHLEVLGLWAEVLPALPRHLPDQWRGARADHLRARWRETAEAKGWTDKAQGLAFFRKLFGYVGQSPFLTGRSRPSDPGKRPFVVELEWLVLPANWAKTLEGKYHQDQAA